MNDIPLNTKELEKLNQLNKLGTRGATEFFSSIQSENIEFISSSIEFPALEEIVSLIADEDKPFYSAFSSISGTIEGNIFFIFDKKSANNLLRNMKNYYLIPTSDRSIEESILTECSNIIISSYLSRFANLTHNKIYLSNPEINYDMIGALITHNLIEDYCDKNRSIALLSEFRDVTNDFHGYFIFFPTSKSIKQFLTYFKEVGDGNY